MIENLSGKISTVLGPINPSEAGITLMHEHVFVDGSCFQSIPEEASLKPLIQSEIKPESIKHLAKHWNVISNHIKLNDFNLMREELKNFVLSGGKTIVEATSIGIGRDPLAVAKMSRATGLNIIMGSSYYIPTSYPAYLCNMTEDDVYDQIVNDIVLGINDTGIKAGLIGEVGIGGSISQMVNRDQEMPEEKVLRASARAQASTGAPMIIHPSPIKESLTKVSEIVIDCGADPSKIVFAHMDIQTDLDVLETLTGQGFNVEYDSWGIEDTELIDSLDDSLQLPNDNQRLNNLRKLINNGYINNLIITQDMFLGLQLQKNGGKGYSHIIDNLILRMKNIGFTQKEIINILVLNPQRILTFK